MLNKDDFHLYLYSALSLLNKDDFHINISLNNKVKGEFIHGQNNISHIYVHQSAQFNEQCSRNRYDNYHKQVVQRTAKISEYIFQQYTFGKL